MFDQGLLFETVLDNFFPSQGFILLDENGHLLESTHNARQLCQLLWKGSVIPSESSAPVFLPAEIKERSELLIQNCFQGLACDGEIQDELVVADAIQIRIQARWVKLAPNEARYILVVLTNLVEVAHNRAKLDALRYCFTPKETEVWQLRLRNFSYREICQHQYVTENTVKHHIKSIKSKINQSEDSRSVI